MASVVRPLVRDGDPALRHPIAVPAQGYAGNTGRSGPPNSWGSGKTGLSPGAVSASSESFRRRPRTVLGRPIAQSSRSLSRVNVDESRGIPAVRGPTRSCVGSLEPGGVQLVASETMLERGKLADAAFFPDEGGELVDAGSFFVLASGATVGEGIARDDGHVHVSFLPKRGRRVGARAASGRDDLS